MLQTDTSIKQNKIAHCNLTLAISAIAYTQCTYISINGKKLFWLNFCGMTCSLQHLGTITMDRALKLKLIQFVHFPGSIENGLALKCYWVYIEYPYTHNIY